MWLDAQGTIFTAECYGHAWTMHAFVCVHAITKILFSTYHHECIYSSACDIDQLPLICFGWGVALWEDVSEVELTWNPFTF